MLGARHPVVVSSCSAAPATMPTPTISALFLALFVSVHQATAAGEPQGISTNVFDFMATANGDYSNRNQTLLDTQEHDLVQARMLTVEVAALGQRPMLYVEQAANGNVQILVLLSVTERPDGLFVLTPHIFTNAPPNLKFGEYNISSLPSLTPDDIQEMKGCDVIVLHDKDCAYLINWPDCSRTIDGNHPTFAIMLTCEEMDAVMPAGGPIKPAPVPYKNKRFGDRYPVPGAGPNYVSPCERNNPGRPRN